MTVRQTGRHSFDCQADRQTDRHLFDCQTDRQTRWTGSMTDRPDRLTDMGKLPKRQAHKRVTSKKIALLFKGGKPSLIKFVLSGILVPRNQMQLNQQ